MPPMCSLMVAVPPIHEPDAFSLQPRLPMPVVPLWPSHEPGLALTKTRRGREKLLDEVARCPGGSDQRPLKEREPVDESTAAILQMDIAAWLMPVGLPGVAQGVLRKGVNVNTPSSRSFPVIPSAASLSRRCETSIINGCACMDDITLLASSRAALIQPTRSLGVVCCAPPVLLLVVLSWVKGPRCVSVGLVERALHRPPFTLGAGWRCCYSVVSRDSYLSTKCSPLNRAVIILPDVLPAALAQEDAPHRLCPKGQLTGANAPRSCSFPESLVRVGASRHLICGLGSALAPVTLAWPLHEAVSTREREGEEGGSLLQWPAAHSFAPHHLCAFFLQQL
jgi:hypothetical protein